MEVDRAISTTLGGFITIKGKVGLSFGIISLFILSALAPLSLGYNVKTLDQMQIIENYDRDNDELEETNKPRGSIQPLDGPMDSAWSMYCHDVRHTGRSPYNTANNPGFEKWFFKCEKGFVQGSAAIDNDGVIYFGSNNRYFYALYPDGSLKWSYDMGGKVSSSGPAIDENGIIYVGTAYAMNGARLFAFYPDGTVKWTYFAGGNIKSSPVIGDDGTIYFGNDGGYPWHGYINALYPNGTLKWRFRVDHLVHSDPAIGLDGTVYCGSDDGYMYALYPNNGTLKWKFGTGDWVGRGACIADDGTVYIDSWDEYLYAVYPDGTLKWKSGISGCTNPIIGEDGIIYVGYRQISAVYPNNGSVKWTFDNVPGRVLASNLCISADGIIYFGTQDGGYIVALNPDGTERWRRFIGECYFAPIIGEDGTIYVGSSRDEWTGTGYIAAGFLHAFGELDPDAPSEPEVSGPTNGKPETYCDYTFKSTSPLGNDLYYYIDWGDLDNTGWLGPYSSGEEVTLRHYWRESDVYTIIARVKDTDDLWGPWGTLDVTIPRNKATNNMLLLRFLEHYPLLQKLLLLIK